MKQYIPRWVKMPEPGEIRELKNRRGKLVALGVVYGILPKERAVLIKAVKLDDKGRVTHNG